MSTCIFARYTCIHISEQVPRVHQAPAQVGFGCSSSHERAASMPPCRIGASTYDATARFVSETSTLFGLLERHNSTGECVKNDGFCQKS